MRNCYGGELGISGRGFIRSVSQLSLEVMCYLLYDVLDGLEMFSVVSFVSMVVIYYDFDMWIDMVQLLLFMLGIYDKDDMFRILLVMFNSKDSCVVMW